MSCTVFCAVSYGACVRDIVYARRRSLASQGGNVQDIAHQGLREPDIQL